MPAKKIRVELFDSEGNRYTIAFEGQITRDKAIRLLDLVELLGGMPNEAQNHNIQNLAVGVASSRFDKVRSVIQKNFPVIWFSSRDVQSIYEQEYKEPISLSTASTYLSRLTNKGWLQRAGESNSLKYKLVPNIPQVTVKQQFE